MACSEYKGKVVCVFQTAFVKGHKRTPSDMEFQELTRQDAQSAMNKELEKLITTAPAGLQQVRAHPDFRDFADHTSPLREG